MIQQKSPSLLGGAMIIAGTAIGAGMLANPTSTAGVWFIGSILALIYTWFCMTTSGLMILEANLHYPTGSSFDTIVKDLLGKSWNTINGLSVAFVLYILTYAYITSGGGITQNLLNQAFSSAESAVDIGRTSGSLIFCLILAAFVWLSTKAVDRFTTVLIVGMVVAFFLSTTGLLSSVKQQFYSIPLLKVSKHIYLIYWPHFQFVSCRLVSTEMSRVSSNITIVMVVA